MSQKYQDMFTFQFCFKKANMNYFSDISLQNKLLLPVTRFFKIKYCSGSMTFWYVSGCGCGSSDPYLWLWQMKPTDSESFFFCQWPSRSQQKIIFFLLNFYDYSFLKVYLHHSSKIKVIKKSQKSINQDFSSFLPVYGRIRIRIRTNKWRIRVQ
jgi:hypothetical protein